MELMKFEKNTMTELKFSGIDKCLRLDKMNCIHKRKETVVYSLFEQAELKPVIIR